MVLTSSLPQSALGSLRVCVLIERILHRLDLGLTSHPNDVESLFSLSDTQDPYPHWLRRKNPDSATTGVWTMDLWYGRHARYRWATDASCSGSTTQRINYFVYQYKFLILVQVFITWHLNLWLWIEGLLKTELSVAGSNLLGQWAKS